MSGARAASSCHARRALTPRAPAPRRRRCPGGPAGGRSWRPTGPPPPCGPGSSRGAAAGENEEGVGRQGGMAVLGTSVDGRGVLPGTMRGVQSMAGMWRRQSEHGEGVRCRARGAGPLHASRCPFPSTIGCSRPGPLACSYLEEPWLQRLIPRPQQRKVAERQQQVDRPHERDLCRGRQGRAGGGHGHECCCLPGARGAAGREVGQAPCLICTLLLASSLTHLYLDWEVLLALECLEEGCRLQAHTCAAHEKELFTGVLASGRGMAQGAPACFPSVIPPLLRHLRKVFVALGDDLKQRDDLRGGREQRAWPAASSTSLRSMPAAGRTSMCSLWPRLGQVSKKPPARSNPSSLPTCARLMG